MKAIYFAIMSPVPKIYDFLGGCFAVFSKKGKSGRYLEKEELVERRKIINRGFESEREN